VEAAALAQLRKRGRQDHFVPASQAGRLQLQVRYHADQQKQVLQLSFAKTQRQSCRAG
jgi:hypothetical protein